MDRLRTERHPCVRHNGDWKASALKAEVWVDTVTSAEENHGRVEERKDGRGQTSPGKEGQRDGSVEFCVATPIGLADESKEFLYGRETDQNLSSA